MMFSRLNKARRTKLVKWSRYDMQKSLGLTVECGFKAMTRCMLTRSFVSLYM